MKFINTVKPTETMDTPKPAAGNMEPKMKIKEKKAKAIIGHGHCPKIFREVYMVGTRGLKDLLS